MWWEYIPSQVWWGVGVAIGAVGVGGSTIFVLWALTWGHDPKPAAGEEEE